VCGLCDPHHLGCEIRLCRHEGVELGLVAAVVGVDTHPAIVQANDFQSPSEASLKGFEVGHGDILHVSGCTIPGTGDSSYDFTAHRNLPLRFLGRNCLKY